MDGARLSVGVAKERQTHCGVRMDSPNSRLRQARIAAGFKTAREAYEKFGWNPNTYRAHESGPREYNKANAFQYAEAFNVDVVWLLTGLHQNPLAPGLEKSRSLRGTVPVLRASNIREILLGSGYILQKARVGEMVPDERLTSAGLGILVEDDSMNDGTIRSLLDGDRVGFDPLVAIIPGCIVGTIIKGDKTLIVRQYRQAPPDGEHEQIDLVPANPSWQPRRVKQADVEWMWRLVKLERNF